jgi:NMD protein affecting ribosome stability and mRNA decay
MDLICYRCGASSKYKKFIDSLCVDCFINERKKKIPDEIIVKVCKDCGKLRIKTWTDKKKINKELMDKLSKYNPIKIVEKDDGIEVTFSDKVNFEKVIKLKKEFTLCDVCSKIRSKYYEAIIQIRMEEGKTKKEREEIEKRLEEIKNSIVENLQKRTFITKIERVKFGYDIYAGSAKDVASILSGCPVKVTKKLYGEVAGKKVYRTTFLLRVSF